MQLFEAHSPLAIAMSQQLSAYSINKSPQETQELKDKLDEIKRRTKEQFLNRNWKALMGGWDSEYSYFDTFFKRETSYVLRNHQNFKDLNKIGLK